MKKRSLVAGLLVFAGASFMIAAADSGRRAMVVHEWGTFLAMSGSDGVSLDGMYHEEHALPAFVHARSRDQLRVRSAVVKGETPVIYFYADARERVRVQVGFPGGFWTQWYPQAEFVGPGLLSAGAAPRPRNGHISWDVEVLPPDTAGVRLPVTTSDALWNHAREVDASYVRGVDRTRSGSPSEWERFIFYRGLGEAPLPVDVRASNTEVVIRADQQDPIRHVYVLRVEDGRGVFSYLPALEPGATIAQAIPTLDDALPVDRFADRLADDLSARLVESGLFDKEARAMVNTWRSSYFRTDGVRVLFLMPQSWTDRYIPLQITPRPAEIVRVMVGRVEVLTPDREQRAESAVSGLASPDPQTRAEAFALLREEGRYVEPIVRRTLETSKDEGVRTLARRLLLTDFVTELRTSLTDAGSGEKRSQEPAFIRAQLASLLREVGLIDEAAQEGKAALAILQAMPPPEMTDHSSRQLFRALARAHEGAGNDAMALKSYGDFVQFGSQRCEGCHAMEGPRDASFFVDWWAGRKYAEYAEKAGQVETLIASHEATLKKAPNDPAARLALGYLREGQRRMAR